MQMGVQSTTKQSVVGVFDSEQAANGVLDELGGMGISPDEVTVMVRDARPVERAQTGRPVSPLAGGAATGAILGGVTGILGGWMIAIGAIGIPGVANGTPAIPGVGTVLPDGVIAAALSGLVLGAAVGALIGALLGLRVPRTEPAAAGGRASEARVLVTVHPSEGVAAQRVLEAMQSGGGYDVRVYDAALGPLAGSQPALVGTPVSQARQRPEGPSAGEAMPPTHAGEQPNEPAQSETALGAGAEGGTGGGEARQLMEPQDEDTGVVPADIWAARPGAEPPDDEQKD